MVVSLFAGITGVQGPAVGCKRVEVVEMIGHNPWLFK